MCNYANCYNKKCIYNLCNIEITFIVTAIISCY